MEGRAVYSFWGDVKEGDYIRFNISPRTVKQVLFVRVLKVSFYRTFRDMLTVCGVEACLPTETSLDAAVEVYHGLRCHTGESFKELASKAGVVAVHVKRLST